MNVTNNFISNSHILKQTQIDTKLGPMVAIADDAALFLLEFIDHPGLKQEIMRLRDKTKSNIISEKSKPIDSITKELEQYFRIGLRQFQTPIVLVDSDFQKKFGMRQ